MFADGTTVISNTKYSNLTADIVPAAVRDAGTYTITPENGSVTLNSDAVTLVPLRYLSGQFVIEKADVTVTVDGSKTYDGTTAMNDTEFEYTINYTNGGNGFDTSMFEVTDFVYNNKNVHTDLTASGTSVLADNVELNFNVTFEYQSTVSARDLNITAASGSTVFNGAEQTLSGVSADNLVSGDTISTGAQVSGIDTGMYGYDLEIDSIIIKDADGNSMLGNYNIVSITDGMLTITSKPVDVTYITSEPYEYNQGDQSDTVSAYYVDVNGEKVYLELDWHGKEFTNPGEYTVTVINPDPNYAIENPSITLVITDVKYSNGPYSEGIYPEYSSTVPSMEAQLLIDRISDGATWGDGNIYTLVYGQLISDTMLPGRGVIETAAFADGSDIAGIDQVRISVDPLVHRPFELDALQKENSELLFANSTMTNVQAFHSGTVMFADANYAESDFARLFETRDASYSPEHEPVYVENDFVNDDLETATISLRAMPVSLPENIFRKVEAAADNLADIVLPEVSGNSFTAVNFKSELDELLESVAGIS